jgi:hypothetical protein
MPDIQKPPGRGRSPQWLRTLAAGLVAKLETRGMTLTLAAAEDVLADRVRAVAATLRITERTARTYVDEDALEGLADTLVESFTAEAPGADLLKLPRDAGLRLSGIGRLVAALAQCAHFFASYVDVDEELGRSRATETVELISTLGLIQASHQTGDVVFAPRALFVRISRILDGVADLTAAADLSRALREDALIARAGSKTHRF